MTRRLLLGGLGAAAWRLAGGRGTGTARAAEPRVTGGFALPGFTGQAVALSPDGTRIAVLGAFGGDVLILDASGRVLRRFPREGTTAELSLDFAGNDLVVIPASSTAPTAMLQLVPAVGSVPARNIPGPGRTSHDDNVAQFYATSTDGSTAAGMVDGAKRTSLVMADLASGRIWSLDLAKALGRIDTIASVALSADGRKLAVGTQMLRLLLLDPTDGSLRSEIQTYPDRVVAALDTIAFSPDGRLVGAGIGLPPNGMTQADSFPGFKVWSIADKAPLRVIETNAQPINQISWSSDGRTVAALVDKNQGGTTLLLADPAHRIADRWRGIPDLRSVRFASRAPVLALLTPDRVDLMTV